MRSLSLPILLLLILALSTVTPLVYGPRPKRDDLTTVEKDAIFPLSKYEFIYEGRKCTTSITRTCPEGREKILARNRNYTARVFCCTPVLPVRGCYTTPMCSMEGCKAGYKRVKYIGCYHKGGASTCCTE